MFNGRKSIINISTIRTDLVLITMIELFFIVLIVGSYVDARSDEVVTIQPGFALQDYLCNGTLLSNITVVLDGGEHRISSEN